MSDLPRQTGSPSNPPPSASGSTLGAQARLIGERVRAARYAAKLTQEELAGTTFSKSYVSAVEHGKMRPSLRALQILAERLGQPISYFLGEDVNESSPEAPEAPAEDTKHAARLREAERVLQEGRYEEAIALFGETGEPNRLAWAHEQYAQFLADQGRFQDAYEQMRLTLHGKRRE